MVSVTLSLPEHTRDQMKRFPEINWSGFIRQAIEDKVSRLSWKEQMLKKVKDEEQDAVWAVATLRQSREARLKHLRSKGLL